MGFVDEDGIQANAAKVLTPITLRSFPSNIC